MQNFKKEKENQETLQPINNEGDLWGPSLPLSWFDRCDLGCQKEIQPSCLYILNTQKWKVHGHLYFLWITISPERLQKNIFCHSRGQILSFLEKYPMESVISDKHLVYLCFWPWKTISYLHIHWVLGHTHIQWPFYYLFFIFAGLSNYLFYQRKSDLIKEPCCSWKRTDFTLFAMKARPSHCNLNGDRLWLWSHQGVQRILLCPLHKKK